MKKIIKKFKAFTLIETMIAVSILTFIFTISGKIYLSFTENYNYSLIRNEVFDETHFLFEQIIKTVRNSNIDYQSYWRENTRITTGGAGDERIADLWRVSDGVSPLGSTAANSTATVDQIGYNAVRNCSGATVTADHPDDYNLSSAGTGRDILENYYYQFIFPGLRSQDALTKWAYNAITPQTAEGRIHLNCRSDFLSENGNYADGNQRNIYDDDEVYGRGPRAFSGNLSSEILWSWSGTLATTGDYPPLLLLGADGKKRYLLRHGRGPYANFCSNGSGCILMLELEATSFDEEGIAKTWICRDDFSCIGNFTSIFSSNTGWKDITPSKIIVTDFTYSIGPEKSAYLAFNENQFFLPTYVTIRLGVETDPMALKGIRSQNSIKLNLQTTISPRTNDLIKSFDKNDS